MRGKRIYELRSIGDMSFLPAKITSPPVGAEAVSLRNDISQFAKSFKNGKMLT